MSDTMTAEITTTTMTISTITVNNNNAKSSDSEKAAAVAASKPATVKNGRRNIDHGWAWVTFVAAFVAQMLTTGNTQNSGIFFSMFLDAFQRPRSETMWIMAVQGTTNSLAGALAGMLVTNYGARTTLIVGSVIFGLPFAFLHFAQSLPYAIICYGFGGIGIPLLLTGIIEASAQYFDKYLYLVMGLVSVGAGLGTTVVGIEMEWALANFGWRTTLLIQSAIVLHICVCASFIFDNRDKSVAKVPDAVVVNAGKDNVQQQIKSPIVDDTQVSKPNKPKMITYWLDPRFVLQTFGYVAFTASRDITTYIMKDLYRSMILSMDASTYSYTLVVTCFGVSSTLGRLISGLVTLAFSPPQANVISTMLCTLGILLLTLSSSMSGFLLVGIVAFGFFSGQQVVYQKQSWGTVFGADVMAALYGYSYVFTCLPRFSVPPIAGFIKDKTGTYTPVIFLASAFMFISALSYGAAYFIHRRKSTGNYAIK